MTWIVIAALIGVVIYLVFAYNGMVALKQRANQAFADIDVQLRQRQDLIPNLVETVKAYAAHERETLDAVIAARNAAQAATTTSEKAAADQQLTGAVRGLLALGEAYPDLKASANFQQLQQQLEGVEDKLAAARRFFNNAVSEYNASLQAVPNVFFANALGFREREFFDVGTDARAQLEVAPTVKF